MESRRAEGLITAPSFLVGHPNYYPRFGFSHALVAGLKNPFATDEAFMGLELVDGALSGIEGHVVYPKVFSELC